MVTSPSELVTSLYKETFVSTFEIVYLTGFAPYRFIRPESNLYYDGRLVFVCPLLTMFLVATFHCAIFLVKWSADICDNARV